MQNHQKSGEAQEDNTCVLRLFIAGDGRNSAVAIQSLHQITGLLAGDYHAEIIDVLKSPHLARDADLAIVPALVVTLADRHLVFYGQLTNTAEILREIERIGSNEDELPGE